MARDLAQCRDALARAQRRPAAAPEAADPYATTIVGGAPSGRPRRRAGPAAADSIPRQACSGCCRQAAKRRPLRVPGPRVNLQRIAWMLAYGAAAAAGHRHRAHLKQAASASRTRES